MGCVISCREKMKLRRHRNALHALCITPRVGTGVPRQQRRCSIYTEASTQESLMELYDNLSDVTLKTDRTTESYVTKDSEKKLAPDEYSEIDSFALQIPLDQTITVELLADYCKRQTNDPKYLVRAFYRWVTEYIRYDIDGTFDENKKEIDGSATTLKTRLATGLGYAILFADLCRHVEVEVKIIKGFTKNIEHDLEKVFTYDMNTDHAWNAVLLKNRWELIDSAWGAGILDSGGKRFLKEYSDFYFFADPKYLIGTHFPFTKGDPVGSKKLQFIKDPIGLDLFSKSVRCTAKAYRWGMRCISHPRSIVISSEITDILFECEKRQLLGVLAVFTDQQSNKTFRSVFVREVSGGIYKATVRPPYTGQFHLQLFGSTEPKLLCYSGLVEYIIVCVKAETIFRPYPEESYISDTWRVSSMAFDIGFDMSIYESNALMVTEPGSLEFSLETSKSFQANVNLKYAVQNDIENITQFATAESSPKRITIKASFPKVGFYKLDVSCRNDNIKPFKHIISYLVDCKHPSNPCLPYSEIAGLWES